MPKQTAERDPVTAVSVDAGRRGRYEQAVKAAHGRSAETAAYGVDPGKDRWTA